MTTEPRFPFDKEPAEGSRETVDRQLERKEHADDGATAKPIDHLPGVKVSGQPQGGAVDRAREAKE
jgi:hypothetical protein